MAFFNDENVWFFIYNAKQILSIVKTASLSRLWQVPTINILSNNKKIYTPANPVFLYKVGCRGAHLHELVYVMTTRKIIITQCPIK